MSKRGMLSVFGAVLGMCMGVIGMGGGAAGKAEHQTIPAASIGAGLAEAARRMNPLSQRKRRLMRRRAGLGKRHRVKQGRRSRFARSRRSRRSRARCGK